jgi:hypothetical protein
LNFSFKKEQFGTLFWQALNKIGQRNYTQWLSGTALSYDNWNAGEPAALATENCVAIELVLMSFCNQIGAFDGIFASA